MDFKAVLNISNIFGNASIPISLKSSSLISRVSSLVFRSFPVMASHLPIQKVSGSNPIQAQTRMRTGFVNNKVPVSSENSLLRNVSYTYPCILVYVKTGNLPKVKNTFANHEPCRPQTV